MTHPFVFFPSCFSEEATAMDGLLFPPRRSRSRDVRWRFAGGPRNADVSANGLDLCLTRSLLEVMRGKSAHILADCDPCIGQRRTRLYGSAPPPIFIAHRRRNVALALHVQ